MVTSIAGGATVLFLLLFGLAAGNNLLADRQGLNRMVRADELWTWAGCSTISGIVTVVAAVAS